MSDVDLGERFDPFGLAEAAMVAEEAAAHQRYHAVALPSGAILEVLTQGEADHLTGKVAAYQSQYALDNVADLAEVDRCIALELLIHRYQVWLGRRHDYNNGDIDENNLQQRVSQLSNELRQVKKTLGIDKVSRDRTTGKGSTHQFIGDLLERARRFGLMRNSQHAKAIELVNQLSALMTMRRNAVTDKERRMMRCEDSDIFEWIETILLPEFEQIDADYRAGDQQMWILTDT